MLNTTSTHRVLILGANGQVGHALVARYGPDGLAGALDRHSLDLGRLDGFEERLQVAIDAVKPSAIINAAAYTAVDQAESEPDRAMAINATAAGLAAKVAALNGMSIVHYSTDYVFDGQSTSPYRENDPTAPLSVYGKTKLAGEQAVLQNNPQALVFRTSWVFSSHGKNFLKTMLALAQTRDQLKVVNDQIGAPTSAALIAQVTHQALAQLLNAPNPAKDPRWGLYHLTASGHTSWHGYAAHVISQARTRGWPIQVGEQAIEPVESSEFAVLAKRPMNSRLSTERLSQAFSLVLPDWRAGVDAVLDELRPPA